MEQSAGFRALSRAQRQRPQRRRLRLFQSYRLSRRARPAIARQLAQGVSWVQIEDHIHNGVVMAGRQRDRRRQQHRIAVLTATSRYMGSLVRGESTMSAFSTTPAFVISTWIGTAKSLLPRLTKSKFQRRSTWA